MTGAPTFNEAFLGNGTYEIQLDHWSDFRSALAYATGDYSEYVYRGHAHSDWLLESSFERLAHRTGQYDRTTHLFNFVRAASGRLETRSETTAYDENDQWALAQHHGLATPLLDWTSSPYVAGFFAFSENDVPRQTASRAIYALSRTGIVLAGYRMTQKVPKNTTAGVVQLFSPIARDNRRMKSQNGLFTKIPDGFDIASFLRASLSTDDRRRVLIKFLVPNHERHNALVDLNMMNINHASLFPDLHGASMYCNLVYEVYGWDQVTEMQAIGSATHDERAAVPLLTS
jgi:hypothetical protein